MASPLRPRSSSRRWRPCSPSSSPDSVSHGDRRELTTGTDGNADSGGAGPRSQVRSNPPALDALAGGSEHAGAGRHLLYLLPAGVDGVRGSQDRGRGTDRAPSEPLRLRPRREPPGSDPPGRHILALAPQLLAVRRSRLGLPALICIAAGYAFDKYDFRGKDQLFGLVLLGVLVLPAATILPLYLLAAKVRLVTHSGRCLIPSVVNPFGVYLARSSPGYVPDEAWRPVASTAPANCASSPGRAADDAVGLSPRSFCSSSRRSGTASSSRW